MAMKTRYTVVQGEVVSDKRGGLRKCYVPNGISSTVALLNTVPSPSDMYSYWPYGEVISATGSTNTPLRFRSNGPLYLVSSSLSYGSWYSQVIGRSLSLPYHYFGSNPTSLRGLPSKRSEAAKRGVLTRRRNEAIRGARGALLGAVAGCMAAALIEWLADSIGEHSVCMFCCSALSGAGGAYGGSYVGGPVGSVVGGVFGGLWGLATCDNLCNCLIYGRNCPETFQGGGTPDKEPIYPKPHPLAPKCCCQCGWGGGKQYECECGRPTSGCWITPKIPPCASCTGSGIQREL
jgi:hypothetical protein